MTVAHRLAALVAALAPLALLGALAAVLTEPEPVEVRELSPIARGLVERIADGADVVLLGNSKVGTDLDPEAIGSLFADDARVVPMNVKGTGMPVWYTVFHDRVIGAGHRPRLVLVYGTLLMMVQTELPTAVQRGQLEAQKAGPNPVLDQKVYGEAFADPRIQVALRRRGEWRQALTDGIRDAAVGVLLAPPGPAPLMERGRDHAVPALAEVFDGDANQRPVARRAVPVVEAEVDEASGSVRVADTLIPDLVALAHENGAQVLFVRSPLPDSQRGLDTVPEALETEVIQYLGAAGAGWLDLRDAPLSAGLFGGVHLSRVGRTRFTPQLLAALEGVGVGTGRIRPAELPPPRVPLAAVRTGSPPALPALELRPLPPACTYTARVRGLEGLSDGTLVAAGAGAVSPLVVMQDGRPLTPHVAVPGGSCTAAASLVEGNFRVSPTDTSAVGQVPFTLALSDALPLRGGAGEEAWWVYPGTELRVTVPAGVVAGARRLRVQALPAVAGAGAPDVALDAAAPVPLLTVGQTVEAVVTGPATAGEWSFTVRSPADGPWLVLRRVVTGTETEPVRLIGPPDAPVSVSLLGEAEFAAEPPALPTPTGPLRATRRERVWSWDVAELGVPSQADTFDAAGTGCSPLDVLERGVSLRRRLGEDRKPLIKVGHPGDLRLTFPDDRTPDAADYGVRLEPSRRCRDGVWLYPGDEATFRVGPEALGAFSVGASRLEVGGVALPAGAEGTLHVVLTVDGVELARTEAPVSALPLPPLELAAPVPGTAQAATLTVRLESADAYVLLTAGALLEPARPALGGAP